MLRPRFVRLARRHRFKELGEWYAEAGCTPSLTTFLNEPAVYKAGNCHPARITVKLAEEVTDYVVVAKMARSSANPGSGCAVTSFCIHDGNGNGYEYAIVEYTNRAYFWRETGWKRYNTVAISANLPNKYDEWHILIGRKSGSKHVLEVRSGDDIRILLARTEITNSYYSGPFTHLSLCGGRPYYVAWIVTSDKPDTTPRIADLVRLLEVGT
jgi:hypothetical protein